MFFRSFSPVNYTTFRPKQKEKNNTIIYTKQIFLTLANKSTIIVANEPEEFFSIIFNYRNCFDNKKFSSFSIEHAKCNEFSCGIDSLVICNYSILSV